MNATDRELADLRAQVEALRMRLDRTYDLLATATGAVAAESAPNPHALNSIYHEGQLSPEQALTFLLTDATRPLTADWDVGDYQVRARRLYADVATGVAPLTVLSVTVVPNLNADLVDGKHYSDIASEIDSDITAHAGDADAHHPWPLGDDEIPNTHTHTVGSIPLADLAELVASIHWTEPAETEAGQLWVVEGYS